MRTDECRRLEDAVVAEQSLGEDLAHHAEACPRCRALLATTALAAPPIEAGSHDEFVARVHAVAAEIAQRRAARWARRRRTVPLVVGAAGYLMSAGMLLLAFMPGPTGHAPAAPWVPPEVGAPTPAAILTALSVGAVWIAVVMLSTRGRRLWGPEAQG